MTLSLMSRHIIHIQHIKKEKARPESYAIHDAHKPDYSGSLLIHGFRVNRVDDGRQVATRLLTLRLAPRLAERLPPYPAKQSCVVKEVVFRSTLR